MTEYIERGAAIDAIMKVYVRTAGYKTRDRILETREAIQKLPAADEPMNWISVEDKLPANETEVLAVCVRNGYRFICPVIYETGTTLMQDSIWNWYELYNYGTYSEENDDYFIPAGWWEARQFMPDDVYNNPVDCAVTHWMPLPEPPKGARMDGDSDALD